MLMRQLNVVLIYHMLRVNVNFFQKFSVLISTAESIQLCSSVLPVDSLLVVLAWWTLQSVSSSGSGINYLPAVPTEFAFALFFILTYEVTQLNFDHSCLEKQKANLEWRWTKSKQKCQSLSKANIGIDLV